MGFKDIFRRGKRSNRRTPPDLRRRLFTAAELSRLTNSWTSSPQTINEVLKSELKTLRARSREQAINNDYAKRFVNLVDGNVIGPFGMRLDPDVRFPGRARKPDAAANRAILAAWKKWGRPENCDLAQNLSWLEMQHLAVRTMAIDGEAIFIEHDGGNSWFALQSIDPELLDVELNVDLGNGSRITMGVETDAIGRVVAYHFIDNGGDPATYYPTGRMYKRVPAKNVRHLFLREFPGQLRGIPWMSASLLTLRNVDEYSEAALINARLGAVKNPIITSETGQFIGDDVDEDGNPVIDIGEPGEPWLLPDGYGVDTYDPTYPSGEYGDFIKQHLRRVASGLGVSYNTWANDLEGVNYSSLRQGALDERDVWMVLQEFVIGRLVAPVYERWLWLSLLGGYITFGDTPASTDRYDSYLNVIWRPRRWKWVDPLKEVNANAKAIETGITSRTRVASEQGVDFADIIDELARERQLMQDAGLLPASKESDANVQQNQG